MELKVSLMKSNYTYDVLRIRNVELLLEKLRICPRVAPRYKKMSLSSFIEWAQGELTPKQFYKLQKLNDLCLIEPMIAV